jgi:hypothetical protein
MKKIRVEAFMIAILFALPGVLVIEGLFFPDLLGVTLVPMGVFGIALWLNTYWTSKKKHTLAVNR